MLDLAGTSSVVTGGASGLGEAAARLLSSRGAHVVLIDLNDDKGVKVAGDIGGTYVRADVSDPGQVIEAVQAAEQAGPLRTLVCAAGIGWASRTVGRDGTFDSAHDLDAFTKVLQVNLIGTFNCIRLAATAMGRLDAVDAARREGRDRHAGLHRGLRRPDRSGRLLRQQGRDRRHDAADRARPRGGRRAPQLRGARAVRHPDLRRGPGVGGVQGVAEAGRRLPEAARASPTSSPR